MKLLADTSALLALALKADAHHLEARKFLKQHPRARFVVSDLVLGELATRLRARAGADLAARVVGDYLRSERFAVVFIDAGTFELSLAKMVRFADKRLSFTDCTSFELMERLGLSAAFSFDDDFKACGFEMLP